MSQHMEALAKADVIRLGRADLKKQIKRGERLASDVVADSPETVATMPLAALLACQPGWGKARVATFLRLVHMSEAKTIGSFTDRQRRTVVLALEVFGR